MERDILTVKKSELLFKLIQTYRIQKKIKILEILEKSLKKIFYYFEIKTFDKNIILFYKKKKLKKICLNKMQ